MDLKPALYYLFIFLLCYTVPYAQDSTITKTDSVYQLSDVVISANRHRTSLVNTASSVTVLTAQDLALTKKNNLIDVLKSEAGISFVQSGGPGKLTTVNIRGANPSHTLILIDGVEMNMPSDPGTVYDFANLPVSDIDRVEILRGPQSTLYGSDAMAGVINIFTRKGTEGTRYYLNAEGGTYTTFSGSGGLSGKYSFMDYNLSLSGMSTKGFSSASEKYGNTEKDGADNKIIHGSAGFQLSDNMKLDIFSKYTDAKADFDQWGGKGGDDPTYKFNLQETVIRPELKINSERWEQTIGISYYGTLRKYSFDSTSAYGSFSSSYYDGKKYKIDWLNNFRLDENYRLTFGADAEKESAVSNYMEYNSDTTIEISFPKNEMNTVGVFLQGYSEVFEGAHLSAGLRYDNHNLFGSIFTYRIAPVYFIKSTGTKIKGTIGTGFKTPSLFNLLDPKYGNKDLDPEESIGWDAGIEQYLLKENILIGVTYFNTEYKNLFGSDENSRSINIKKAETNGIEFYSEFSSGNTLKLKLNYTYAKSIDKNDTLSVEERKLKRRPEHKAAFNINYLPFEKLALNLEYIYTGIRKDENLGTYPTELVDLEAYNLLSFAASYNIFEYLEVYTRFENILDEDYEEVYGYGTPGFSVYGGVKLNLD